MGDAPDIDALETPVAWTEAGGQMAGCNPAFARWLVVSARRLPGARGTSPWWSPRNGLRRA